jgi:hypothetical protein
MLQPVQSFLLSEQVFFISRQQNHSRHLLPIRIT